VHVAPLQVTEPASDIEHAPEHDKSSRFDVAVTELPDSNVKVDVFEDMLSTGVLIDEPDRSVTCFVVESKGSAPSDDSKSIVVSEVVVSTEPRRFIDWNESRTASPYTSLVASTDSSCAHTAFALATLTRAVLETTTFVRALDVDCNSLGYGVNRVVLLLRSAFEMERNV
jgi:hypothetical protein